MIDKNSYNKYKYSYEMPKWFDLKNYDQLKNFTTKQLSNTVRWRQELYLSLTSEGWFDRILELKSRDDGLNYKSMGYKLMDYKNISCVYRCSHLYEGIRKKFPSQYKEEGFEFFPWVCDEDQYKKRFLKLAERWLIEAFQLNSEAIEERSQLVKNYSLPPSKDNLDGDELARVNLEGSDEEIIEDFAKWLKYIRNNKNPKSFKPLGKEPEKGFYDSLLKNNTIPCMDLMIWETLKGANENYKPLANKVFGEALSDKSRSENALQKLAIDCRKRAKDMFSCKRSPIDSFN